MDALIYQPIEGTPYETTLLVKNNYTGVFPVKVSGKGGFGNLAVVDIKRFDFSKNLFVRSVRSSGKMG